MTQIATVERILTPKTALVKIVRGSACGKSCETCTDCALSTNRELLVPVENTANARKGDTVTLESPTGRVLRFAFMVYLFPFLLLLAVYAVCGGLGMNEGEAALSGVFGFLLAVVITMLYHRRVSVMRGGEVRIVRVHADARREKA